MGYDSNVEDVAAKLRLDVKFNDTISAFIMAGYQSDYNTPNVSTAGVVTGPQRNRFVQWEGNWVACAGFSAKSDKATINGRGAYGEDGTYAFALNVAYQVVLVS